MLSYKCWLDTRSRFFVGLIVIAAMAVGIVTAYPQIRDLLPTVDASELGSGPLSDALRESIETQRTFEGYVFTQWFEQNFRNVLLLFAALLGSGSALTGSGRGLTLTLALPVSRARWLGARAATGLAELFAIAFVPPLVISALAPTIGEHYMVGAALAHGAFAFVVATVFFSFALLLSAALNALWTPVLLTCVASIALAMLHPALPEGYHPFEVMSGASYFESGSVPWLGLLSSAAASAALLLGARALIERRDF